MKQRMTGSMAAAMCLAALAGCAATPPATNTSDSASELTPCKDPRPEICTMQYDPVCGVSESGDSKTYSNACAACSNRAVLGYNEGACATDRG